MSDYLSFVICIGAPLLALWVLLYAYMCYRERRYWEQRRQQCTLSHFKRHYDDEVCPSCRADMKWRKP